MLQITRIDLRHKLQLLIRTCFLSDYRLLFVRFLLLTLSMWFFFCWKRHSTKTVVLLFLRYLAQQTNTYSKSAAETLKANSRDCASLLTTCSMSKTLFKCFLVYYEHVFVYCDVFAVTISFSMSLLSIFWTDFTPWSTFICYQFCIESRRSHQRCSLKKVFSKITQYFQEKPCVRVSF